MNRCSENKQHGKNIVINQEYVTKHHDQKEILDEFYWTDSGVEGAGQRSCLPFTMVQGGQEGPLENVTGGKQREQDTQKA